MSEATPKTPPRPCSLINSLLIGVILFALLGFLFEGLFHFTSLDETLRLRSLGIYHGQFEIKWFGLKDYVRDHGGVDVILLGNSMVNTGIQPELFSYRYGYDTGSQLRVFNFGVEGLTIAPNSVIARLLVEKYHPATLVYVTEMRDYVSANGVTVEAQILGDEWMTAQRGGKVTFRAWLKDNSTLIQHLLPFRNWSRADFPDTFLAEAYRFRVTTASGYEPEYQVGENIDVPPDPADPKEKANFALFANFSIDLARLANLADMLSLSDEGTNVIVTEMPVYPTYYTYFGGEQYHDQYLKELTPFITEHKGVLIPAVPWQSIPLSFRADDHHLNDKGAALFSILLADQLAGLCQSQGACLRAAPVAGEAQ